MVYNSFIVNGSLIQVEGLYVYENMSNLFVCHLEHSINNVTVFKLFICDCFHLYPCSVWLVQAAMNDYVADPDLDHVAMEEEVSATGSSDPTIRQDSSGPAISPSGKDLDSMKCLWCQTVTDEHESVLDRGLGTFLEHCKANGRLDLVEYVELTPDRRHLVHRSCSRAMAYSARKARTKAFTSSEQLVRKSTRSSTGRCIYSEMCFLCGLRCQDCDDFRKVMSGSDFDDRIRKIAHERGLDDWAVTVLGRLDGIVDLFAADAVYHQRCYVRFIEKLPHTPHKRKRGRPINSAAEAAFQMLCTTLEQECENDLYTLEELHSMMTEMAHGEESFDVYGRDYFKELLVERYGAHINFASRHGRDDVVGFSKFCDLLLHNKYFADRSEGEGSESERLVKKAAGLIKAEIREHCYNRDFYPTTEDVTGDGTKFVPSLLKVFLSEIMKSSTKRGCNRSVYCPGR